MGILDKLLGGSKKEDALLGYFKTINAYTPSFTTFEGGLYEMELTRAAIHSFATHVSKLKPEVKGSQNEKLARLLQYKPNPFQDTTKFLYRLATILQVQNNAFIIPIVNELQEIVGYYPLLPDSCAVKEYQGRVYLVYSFNNGNKAAIEYEKIGLINQFQYKDEFFGESNKAMQPTLELLNTQNQGIIEGVKSSATIRFIAKLANVLKNEDIEKERKRFTEANLSYQNQGGVMLIDNKYEDVKQIVSKPYTVDGEQMRQIKENVFNYFGTSEAILQNKYTSDQWNAYYEGKIEPFAIQLSLVMSNMTFTEREIAFGNSIIFTANRLQYLTNNEKLSTVTQLFDRGFLTHNQGLEIFNMAGIGEDGDKRYIRKEYAETENLDENIQYVPMGDEDSADDEIGGDDE